MRDITNSEWIDMNDALGAFGMGFDDLEATIDMAISLGQLRTKQEREFMLPVAGSELPGVTANDGMAGGWKTVYFKDDLKNCIMAYRGNYEAPVVCEPVDPK